MLRTSRDVWNHLSPTDEWHGYRDSTSSSTSSTSDASSAATSSAAYWLLHGKTSTWLLETLLIWHRSPWWRGICLHCHRWWHVRGVATGILLGDKQHHCHLLHHLLLLLLQLGLICCHLLQGCIHLHPACFDGCRGLQQQICHMQINCPCNLFYHVVI